MKVRIIGARALNPIGDNKIRKHASAIFYSHNLSLQIDCGSRSLWPADFLLITHLHSDHIGQIKSIRKSVRIYVPHKSFQDFLAQKYGRESFLFAKEKKTELGCFKVLAFRVQHSRNTAAFGYLLQADKKNCLWLPDFRHLPNCLKYFKNLDALFIGASTFDQPINTCQDNKCGHLPIRTTLKILRRKKIKPKQIYLIHLGRRMVPLEDKIKMLKKEFSEFKINFAYDGEEIIIK